MSFILRDKFYRVGFAGRHPSANKSICVKGKAWRRPSE